MLNAELRQKLWSLVSKTHSDSSLIIRPDNKPSPVPLHHYFAGNIEQHFLELGSGWCEVVLQLAEENVNMGFIAMERKWNRLRRGFELAEQKKLQNIFFSAINFQWFLSDIFPENSFDTVLLNFPDPWPKKKHHKNRSIDQNFLKSVYNILKPGGKFLFATDHFGYARWTIRHLRKFNQFESTSQEYCFERPALPISSFEQEKMDEGKRIFYLERSKPWL